MFFIKAIGKHIDTKYDTFKKQGCQPITIPKSEPIIRVYIEMVRQVVGK